MLLEQEQAPAKGSHQKKSTFLSDIVQKGGGSTGIQKFWGSFVFPYFDPILDNTLGERRGVDHVPKVVRHFLPNFVINIEILGL